MEIHALLFTEAINKAFTNNWVKFNCLRFGGCSWQRIPEEKQNKKASEIL